MKFNKVPVEMKINTGAEVSVISESLFRKLKGTTLKLAINKLHSPGSHTLTVLGKFTATLMMGKQIVK